MDTTNLWSRRNKYILPLHSLPWESFPNTPWQLLILFFVSSTSKLSLSTSGSNHGDRQTSFSKRFGGDNSSHGGKNPFNSVTTPGGLASPGGANFALGAGTGVFSAFGSSSKTPKSPATGNPFDNSLRTLGAKADATSKAGADSSNKAGASAGAGSATVKNGKETSDAPASQHQLRHSWCFWFRPSIPKSASIAYDETVHGVAEFSTVEEFFAIYRHLVRPSTLKAVSDYHLFKKGIRPIWEDEENRKGGKFVVRLRKGVADRYWEDLLLALIGEQFGELGDEICGAVVSIRNGEDIISIWTASSQGRVLKIR